MDEGERDKPDEETTDAEDVALAATQANPLAELPKAWDSAIDTETDVTRKWAPAHKPPPPRPEPEAPPSVRMSFADLAPFGDDDQQFFKRYELRTLLGAGGMGEVRLCKDRVVGREVAMKTIVADHAADKKVRGRFEREAHVQGQLEHPAIVPVYDIGVAPNGAVYFTMKRLRGVTFHEILWKLRTEDPEAKRTYTRRKMIVGFLSACQAVAFAHSRGVLHRDLKPANIMLGDFGEVYVLDWGLSKVMKEVVSPIEAPDGHSTLVGEIVGTPGYMAPEQAIGATRMIDERADVYSLGTILFEILTLEPLHDGESASQAMKSTIFGTDCRPTERTPERDISPELDKIVVRATSRSREDRHGSAAELCADIERYLDGERDMVQVKKLAKEHAARAREAAKEAQDASAEDAQAARTRAMEEVTAAIALNPGDPDAIATLVDLLLNAPPDLPREAEKELRASRRANRKEGRRGTLYAYISWLLFVPLAMALGVRSLTKGALVLGAMLVSTLLAWANVRGFLRSSFVVFAVGTVAMAATSLLAGWALLLPGIVAVHTLGYLLSGDERKTVAAVFLGVLAVAAPFILESANALPAFYRFENDQIVIVPHLTHFPPRLTRAFLLFTSLGVVLLPAFLTARFRRTLSGTERRLFAQVWNLRHLVPKQARRAAVPKATPSTTIA